MFRPRGNVTTIVAATSFEISAVPAAPFLNFIFLFGGSGVVLQRRLDLRLVAGQENAMQRSILTAAVLLGIITTAHAQTTTGAATDPLSVPTSPLPFSSFFAGTSAAPTSGSSTPGSGSSSGISAPASRSSQVPRELPGEGLDTATQSAGTTAAAPSAPSTICPPSIPTTDGGSANITVIDGFSPGGC